MVIASGSFSADCRLDEAAAIEVAAKEFKIDDTLKNRLVARRADDH